MADIAASVLARLKKQGKRKREKLPALLTALLSRRISAPFGPFKICCEPCTKRRTVYIFSY